MSDEIEHVETASMICPECFGEHTDPDSLEMDCNTISCPKCGELYGYERETREGVLVYTTYEMLNDGWG